MALTDTITFTGAESWRLQGQDAVEEALKASPVETLTAAGAASIWGVTILNSAAAACDATLADGEVIGQRKTFIMSDASNSTTVTVANHVTSDPEVFTFAQVGDALELIWNGTDWSTLANSNAAT
jgi:hypothetical protein